MSERKQQQALVEWCGYQTRKYPELRLLFHIPNGGARSSKAGALMKKMGARAGVPDLCLPIMRGGHGALWIEMKDDGGRLRKSQKAWRDRLQEAGHAYAVCRSWIEAKEVIEDYLNETEEA